MAACLLLHRLYVLCSAGLQPILRCYSCKLLYFASDKEFGDILLLSHCNDCPLIYSGSVALHFCRLTCQTKYIQVCYGIDECMSSRQPGVASLPFRCFCLRILSFQVPSQVPSFGFEGISSEDWIMRKLGRPLEYFNFIFSLIGLKRTRFTSSFERL